MNYETFSQKLNERLVYAAEINQKTMIVNIVYSVQKDQGMQRQGGIAAIFWSILISVY